MKSEDEEEMLSRMRSSEEAEAIIRRFQESGYSPIYEDMSAARTNIGKRTQYESISLPFESDRDDVLGARILWSTVNSSATGYVVRESSEYVLDIYQEEGDEIVSRTVTDSDLEEVMIEDEQATSQTAECPPYCPTNPQMFTCSGDIDWECVGDAAGTAGIACYPCSVDPSRVTCVPCTATVVMQSYDMVDGCCDGSWTPVY